VPCPPRGEGDPAADDDDEVAGVIEKANDPHRLARLFLDSLGCQDKMPFLRYWQEWQLYVGMLYLRMRSCTDADVLARLRALADATPRTLAEWLALGRRIIDTEHELRQQGKLPEYPWPDR
jgi:hypothetical protein